MNALSATATPSKYSRLNNYQLVAKLTRIERRDYRGRFTEQDRKDRAEILREMERRGID